MPEMRRLLPLSALVATGALLLAGCAGDAETETGTESTVATTVECAPSGTASESISVSTTPLEEPTVEFASGLTATATEVSVITEGTGTEALSGSGVTVRYAVYNGTTGEQVFSTGFTEDIIGQTITIAPGTLIDGLTDSLGCASAGDRLAVVIPPVEAWGSQGNESIGISGDDTLVFIVDVVSVAAPAMERADGVDQEPEPGFPTVVLAEDGSPTVTIPSIDPPRDLGVAVLKQGSGEVVPEGATVTVHYTGVNWRTGEVFDSSWDRGSSTSFSLNGVVTGFAQGIAGQNVGSQVIVVIPPELGYGPQGGNSGAGIEADDTIVFVIDILGFAA